MVFLITYDLIKNKDYDELFEAIKSLATDWWHCLDSTWFIVHPGPAKTIRDALLPHIDSDDKLLVATMGNGAAWTTTFSEECQAWLRKNL